MAGLNDTIYALSSGPLPAGVAVVRISGPAAEPILLALSGKAVVERFAQLATLRRQSGEVLDRAIAIFFPSGKSFTGEPVAELHLHGGRAVLRSVYEEIAKFPGTRLAEAGEFTRRAFLNGRMDLTAAEGVADLIAAETEAQRRFAVNNAVGQQYALYSAWRTRLIEARALIEADLDFSDEADVPGSVADTVREDVRCLRVELEAHLENARRGEILRDGFRVVIMGEPNVGKSSLLNALAQRDVAIVSDEPGTTRDLIEVALDLDGYKIVFTDTAGLRDTENAVERQGIDRARKVAEAADLVLYLRVTGQQDEMKYCGTSPVLEVATKFDLSETVTNDPRLAISTRTGAGIAKLLAEIAERASAAVGSSSLVMPSQERQIGHLRRALEALRRSEARFLPIELCAEELRLAANHLGEVTGAIGVEDLLDVIFSRFCIGK